MTVRFGLVPAAAALVGLTLLFVGDPEQFDPRWAMPLWDLGHVPLFALVTWLAIQSFPRLQALSTPRLLLWTLAAVLLIGILVEALQYVIGREASLADLLRNALGAALVVVYRPRRSASRRGDRRWAINAVVGAMLILVLLPFAVAVVDTALAWRQFPLLSNFENPLEMTRWQGDYLRRSKFGDPGNHVLRVLFTTDRYSAIKLDGMPRDWRGYRYLRFRVYLSGSESLPINIRISDRLHRQSQWRTVDRFEETLSIAPGWNRFELSLEAIRRAPDQDPLDMSRIDNLGFYTYRAAEPRVVRFDDFELGN